MSSLRAALHIEHDEAEVLQLDADNSHAVKIKAHVHPTRQHASAVRTEHEFFAEVCDALAGISDVLVVGSHQARAGFRHYVGQHRAALLKQIVGWKAVDHPTEGQLVAMAREYFIEHDNMARTQQRM